MPAIDRDQVKRMVDEHVATLVEVLEPQYYAKFHLPSAINVPLGDGFEQAIQRAVPDKDQPVVVYCLDRLCDASPQAVRRMEALGYERVYDYEAGKMDWQSAGLPIEG